ncbi:MAG: hypothetical protein CMN76_19005 [Spirochaetaceae bacterium]|nr:hypothetical protein [Spirochaetaceae bacterium]|tara:strand:- start:109706 stop:112279 length:2574 start_codon:yes stop_codon:yes gene_type:complete
MPVIGMVGDRNGTILYVNPQFEKTTGYSRAEAVGNNFFDLLVLESDRSEARTTLGEMINSADQARKLGPIVTKDGQVKVVEWTGCATAQGNFVAMGNELNHLEANPSRLREILDGMPANIVLLDREGRILEINLPPLKGAGLAHEEVVGRLFLEQPWFTEEVERERFRRVFARALKGNVATDDFNLRFSEELRVVAGVFAPVLSEGRVESVIGFGSDITERRQAEESARRAEHLLKTVVAGAPVLICSVDQEGRITSCEGEDWSLLSNGKSLAGTLYSESFETLPSWKYAIARALSGETSTVEEKVGSKYYEATFLSNHNGSQVDVTGVAFDITHRKVFEQRIQQLNQELESKVLVRTEALNESEERFRQIAETVRDVFFIATPELKTLRYVSPAFDELWGQSGTELIKNRGGLLERVHPADRARVDREIQRSLDDRRSVNLEFQIQRDDSTERWIRLRTFHLPLSGESRVAGVVEDITESMQFRMELIASRERADRANKAKSEFTARMSHELRTPLNAILGFVQVLRRKLGSEHSEELNEVREAGHHLLSLIDDLLDISRVETDQLQIKTEPLPVRILIDQATRYLANRVRRRDQALSLDVESDVWVKGDRTRVIQILINLLSNANKYTPAGGAISILVRSDADRVRIHVRDNGPGIASEQLGKLFIPFERLGRSAGSGVGLGLYLSRELARRMDGNLGVQSESDHGADFWLELPVAESQPHRASKAGAAMESIGPLDVLYIEDNPVNLRVMESMFSIMENVTFRGVDNAEAGILEAQRHIPDIILVDMHLGDTDGYHVLEELREVSSFRAVPIIAVSADAMADNIQNALAAGFSAYVSKPVQMDELVGCIKRLLS